MESLIRTRFQVFPPGFTGFHFYSAALNQESHTSFRDHGQEYCKFNFPRLDLFDTPELCCTRRKLPWLCRFVLITYTRHKIPFIKGRSKMKQRKWDLQCLFACCCQFDTSYHVCVETKCLSDGPNFGRPPSPRASRENKKINICITYTILAKEYRVRESRR